MAEPTEIKEVTERTVACDGGSGALGHPRVFLQIGESDEIDCPYCGCRFVLKVGVAAGGGH